VRRRGSAKTTVTWATAGGEVEADGWEDLAKKLKAPAGRKGATETQQRLRVLNRLGADGWEVFSHQSRPSTGVTEVWGFKRKVR
jgi:hypothetical protein